MNEFYSTWEYSLQKFRNGHLKCSVQWLAICVYMCVVYGCYNFSAFFRFRNDMNSIQLNSSLRTPYHSSGCFFFLLVRCFQTRWEKFIRAKWKLSHHFFSILFGYIVAPYGKKKKKNKKKIAEDKQKPECVAKICKFLIEIWFSWENQPSIKQSVQMSSHSTFSDRCGECM